jgi:hypothetical protein
MRAGRLHAALATAAFLTLAAPTWACGPPGSMNNDNGSGQNNNGGMAGQSQGDNNNGSSGNNSGWGGNNNGAGGSSNSAGGGDHGGGWDNSGGDDARQGASDQANSDMGGGDDNGPRRSQPTDNQTSANYSNQIGALGAAQANGNVDECRRLRAELDGLTSDDAPDPEDDYKRANLWLTRVMAMPPALLQKEIDAQRQQLDADRNDQQWSQDSMRLMTGRPAGPRVAKYGSATLNFLLDLQAAKMAGVGEDGMQRRMQGYLAKARTDTDAAKAERRQKIADLQNRISNLNCGAFLPSANQNVGSPSASPSPSQ